MVPIVRKWLKELIDFDTRQFSTFAFIYYFNGDTFVRYLWEIYCSVFSFGVFELRLWAKVWSFFQSFMDISYSATDSELNEFFKKHLPLIISDGTKKMFILECIIYENICILMIFIKHFRDVIWIFLCRNING